MRVIRSGEAHICPKTRSMKKTILVYGLIAGALVSTLLVISMSWYRADPDAGGAKSMFIGYASMLLSFFFIYIAVKSYRDKQSGGTISFGKAFGIGLWVAVIASICYTITWIIFYRGFYPGFMDDMTSRELAKLRQSGKSAEEIAAATNDMEQMSAMYSTWPGLIGFTLLEILPLGVLVSLICAFLLKRKQSHPDLQFKAV